MKITLGKYKNMNLSYGKISVCKEEVEKYIYSIREKYKVYVSKDEEACNSDYVSISYEGFFNGFKIDELSRDNHQIKLGEGFFFNEFEEQLVGRREGEEFKTTVVLGEDFHLIHLQDKEVEFRVKIQSVQMRVVPELNDEWVKRFDIHGVGSVEELISYSFGEIFRIKEEEIRVSLINRIMKEILIKTVVELDEVEVSSLKDSIYKDFIEEVKKNNISLEGYLAVTQKSKEELIKECEDEAELYLKEKSVIEEIERLEGINLYAESGSQSDKEKNYIEVMRFLIDANTVK